MNKVTSYFKNVSKSVVYASVDVTKTKLIPEVGEFVETNEELFKAVYSTVSNARKSIRHGKKIAMQSQIYKDINIGIDNIFEDIKTGNFYNKERAQASIDASADYMAGGGFDDMDDFGDLGDFDFDFDDDDGSLDDFQDKPTKGDVVIADTVAKSSNLSSQLISRTVAETSSNIIKANMASTNLTMAQNMELVAGIRTSIAGVHESINRVLKFNTETVVGHMNTQVQFYNDSINIMKENNAILKELVEMQRNVYNKELEKETIKDAYSDVYSGGGNIDLTAYFKAIGKNVKNMDKSGILSTLLADQGGASMLSQFLSNPIGGLVKGMIEQFIPATFAKSVASFSKSLGNLFPAFIAKMNKWKNDEDGIRGFLGSLFGIKTDTKDKIDTSKYNKGAVPFDGITRKAIVDVIPEHLSRIESLLSGKSQRLFDYHTGKWMSTTDIKKQSDAEYERLVRDSFSDISDDIRRFVSEVEKSNKLNYEQKKSLEDDIYKMMEVTFKKGGHFSPEELKSERYENDTIMEALLDAISGTDKFSLSKISSVAGRSFDNVRRRAQMMRDYQSGGDSIIRKLYDNSDTNSHLKFHDKYKDQVIGSKVGFLSIRDDSGMNVMDYLKGILANVSFIREYGSTGGSGGSEYAGRKWNNRPGISFDKYYKQFDKEYTPEHIQKLIEKENKSEESYEKYHEQTDKQKEESMDDVLLRAAYTLKKNKFSDLDEDIFDNFGKRYKYKNRYQKEAEKIAGENFIEKFANAKDAKEKKIVVFGALSDMAKKPAEKITELINSAENSIYNFLFKAESDEWDEELGQKIKGFFPGLMNQMRGAWDNLVGKLEEKVLDPLADKFGLRDKWDGLKDKIKGSKPMELLRNAGLKVKGALLDDSKAIGRFIMEALGDVASPIINDPAVAQQLMNHNTRAKYKAQRKLVDQAVSKATRYNKNNYNIGKIDISKAKINKTNPTNAGGTVRLIEDGWVFGHKGEALVPADQVDKATNAKAVRRIIEEANNNVISNDYRRNLSSLANDHIRELIKAPTGIIASLEEFAPKSSKIADKYNSRNEKIKGKMNESGPISAINNELHKAAESGGAMLKSGLGKVTSMITGIEGETLEEQKASFEKKKKTIGEKIGNFLSDMDGEWAPTVSKMLIGGGLGLLTGFAAGPIIGAGIGGAYSLSKNNKTINEFLFGKNRKYDDDGKLIEKEGGLISADIQNTFKKYLPDAGKGAALGTIASFVTPFGPLLGAAVGAGIGLAKNSTTLNKMLFGDDEGLFNKDRKEAIRKHLPKAAIGAAAGMFLGPFGLLGNAVIGSGLGLLTGTEEFKDLFLGEKDANGNRLGGIIGTMKEHFVEPIIDFGRNFKEDFFGFIRESMIDPLNQAITPIAEGIAFQTKRVVFGIPKMFAQLGKDYIAVPILNKINDKLIDPISKGIKGLFGGLFSTVKGLVSLPFRAVGRAGKQARKFQVKHGRDVVARTAADRLKFADQEGLGNYKYRNFDETVRDNADNQEWLEELTARTGLLAHGAKHFDKEVKNARDELSKVVSAYAKIGWFSKDKETYNLIRQYIHNNDVEAAIVELTNIQKSRTTGGPLGSEAGEAITRFNRANKAYQIARDRRDKFGDINDTDNAAWMEKNFGPNWRSMKADRLFNYANRELSTLTGKAEIAKSDLLSDPRNIITKGEGEIKAVLDKIYKLLSGDKDIYTDENDEAEYNRREAAGIAAANANIKSDRAKILGTLNENGFKLHETSPLVDKLHENPLVYELVLFASKKGIQYDHATILKLCKMKLSKRDIKLLKRYPFVAFADSNTIKKNLNYVRNDHASADILKALHIRNNNLDEINSEQQTKNKYTQIYTEHGVKRYVMDDKGKSTVDTSDAETSETIQRENEEREHKRTFMDSVIGLKNSVFGIFNRHKEKDEEEKKEPWYKKLFGFDLGEGIGGKIKFGALLLTGFTAMGALTKFFTETDLGQSIAVNVKNVINPSIEKIGNWFTNEGEYSAPDKGVSGFLDKYVFPNLFTGMDAFFGKVLPAITTAFVKNIPTIVNAAIQGISELFGWTDRNHKNDSNVSIAQVKGSESGTTVDATIKANTTKKSWLSNLFNRNKATAPTDSTGTSTVNENTGSELEQGSTEPVMVDGIGILYKKNKKGKLVPITMQEMASGKVTEFYNETGKGHWEYDEDSKGFVCTSGTGGANRFPLIVGYAAIKSTLTGRVPAIFRGGASILKGADNVLSHVPGYKLLSVPVKTAGKTFEAVTTAGARAGIYGRDKFKSFLNKAVGAPSDLYDNSLGKNASKAAGITTKKGTTVALNNGKFKTATTGNRDSIISFSRGVKQTSSKVDDTYKSGLVTRIIAFAKDRLSKILNNSTVYKKITEAIGESGVKKSAKTIIKSIIDKFTDGLAKLLVKSGSSAIVKIAGGLATAGVLTAIFVATDFIAGVDKAESILGISNPTKLQEFIAGLVNVVANEIFFGFVTANTLVDWSLSWIFPIFNIDASEFKEARAKEDKETTKYNLANGENLSTEERLRRNNSVLGKTGTMLKKGWNSAINSVKDTGKNLKDKVTNFGDTKLGASVKSTGQKLKEGISGIGDKIGDTFGTVTDYAEYSGLVIKDVFKDAISGKNVETKGIKLDKDDPDYDTKSTLYNIIKIATFLPALKIKGARFIYDKFLEPIGKGIIEIGSGIGKNVTNLFKQSWNGHFIEAMMDPGVDTGHPATNILSKTITHGLIKPMLAPIGLLTSVAGAAYKNANSIVDGFKTIGSSVISSVTSRFKDAWSGNVTGVFQSNNPNTGNKLVDDTAAVINSMSVIATALPALGTAAIGAGVRGIDKIINSIKKINPSASDSKILSDARNGNIKIWNSEYWKISGAPDGIAGALYRFNAYLEKVLNIPSALLGLINPANWDMADGISDGVQKFAQWLGIAQEYNPNYIPTGSGTGRLSGKGTDSGFVSQVDPKYANKRFNTSQDTERQTLGDSGCAPATAANVINLYAGSGSQFDNASKAALRYKSKNSGVTPDYFEDYLGGKGIIVHKTNNKRQMLNGIGSGMPTVLLGRNKDKSSNTPYGTSSSHYVLATGLDGRGNVIVQDPESRKPNRLYPVKDVLDNSDLGMITGRATLAEKFSKAAMSYYDDKLISVLGLDQPMVTPTLGSMTTGTIGTTTTSIPNSYTGPLTGTGADVIRIAQSQIGYKAGPGKDSKYDERDRGGWCGYFVRWCYQQAGLGKLYCGGGTTGSPKQIDDYYRKHGQQVSKYQGQPGDIVVFYADRHHVGLIEKYNGDGTYSCIEGNTGGGNGKVQRLKRSISTIYSISRPFLAARGSKLNKYQKISVSSPLAGRGTQFQNAANAALKYKDANSGVTPDYFEDYLGRSGINTHSTTDKQQLVDNIRNGNPTILLGHDPSGRSNTPYGPSSSHYVLATGIDDSGNIIIQDPESRQPNTVYPADQVIQHTQLGMVTSKSSGRGSRRRSGKGSVSRIKTRVNRRLSGRGPSKAEVEKTVWSALRAAGYTEVQVAGVMGNIKHESGFNPSIVERSNGIGFGLCQWSYGRRTNLEKYAKSIGKSPGNLNVQITFLLGEMNKKGGANGYAKYQFTKSSSRYDGRVYSGDSFKKAKDIETATKAFCFCFERPSYDSSVNHISSRIKSAKNYYEKYTGTPASSVSIDPSNTGTNTSTNVTDNIFSRISKAATSYYDKRLLTLLGFEQQETTVPTTTDNTVSSDGSILTTSSGATGTAAAILQLASKQVGNGGSKYQSYCGIGGLAWCAAFVCWVFNKAGAGKLFYGGKKSAYCPTILDYYKKRGQVVNKSQGEPGDMIFFDWDHNGNPNHIGIIEKRTKSGYVTIEGNAGNRVKRLNRSLSVVMAVVRPKWGGLGSGINKANGLITTSNLTGRGSGKIKRGNIAAITRYNISGKGSMSTKSDKSDKLLLPDEHSAGIANLKVNKSIVNSTLLSGAGSRSYTRYSVPKATSARSISGRGTTSTGSSLRLPALNSGVSRSTVSNTGYLVDNSYGYSNNGTNNSTNKLLATIIEVLGIIANNSEKLSEIVSLLSKALDVNLTNEDISKLSSNNSQIKNKIANALRAQGSPNGMGNSIMDSTTESLAAAMYSIATA